MKQRVLKHRLVFFYGFTFLISWTFWLLMSMVYDGGQPGLLTYATSTLGGLGPLFSLFLLQKLTNEEISVKAILSTIRIREIRNPWAVLAIFGLPILTVLGNIGYYIVGQESQMRLVKSGPDELGGFVILVVALQFTAGLVTSPLFEEPGWRGFALGQLQQRYGKLLGSLVVGLLWWLWHQAMNLTFGIQPTVHSILSMLVVSFTIDSLFNLSGKNLFTAMLAHQSYGTVFTFLYEGNQNWLILGLKIVFLVVLRWIENSRRINS